MEPARQVWPCWPGPTGTSSLGSVHWWQIVQGVSKKRSLRDWHPKKWFQGQPVKMCRCKSFLLVVSKAVSCSCPLGRTKISKSFRNSILTWYMLYLYEWRPKMQKKIGGAFSKVPIFRSPKVVLQVPESKNWDNFFTPTSPPQWWSRFSFSSFTTFGRVIGKFWILSSFLSVKRAFSTKC